MKEKPVGILQAKRLEKETIRGRIALLQERIALALTASRVPSRIVNGDAEVCRKWKVDFNTEFYHRENPPRPRSTVNELLGVETKLTYHLKKIT